MRFPALRRICTVLGVCASLGTAGTVAAQVPLRPALDWRTVRTENFDVHYPLEMERWTLDVVSRMEGSHAAVKALVGFAPASRVTVVVEDPENLTNGSALPMTDRSVISLWPTPPDARSILGENRGFGELLIVHEFAHVAHLSRPTRNPRRRLLTRIFPVKLGPVLTKGPRWVTEGYATYVEGRITGSGRPHGVNRSAVLRQRALEGRLPTYAELSGSSSYQGNGMAYLAGSAYLQWLVDQKGEASLVHLWRRMSARQNRSFAEAFAGVYGGQPADLYGRFTVELTAQALAAKQRLESAGVVTGDTVQRLRWSTGDPALSRDGKKVAIVLRAAGSAPSRLVVWNTEEAPEDSATRAARARALEKDPEDVAAIDWRPREKKAVATLRPVDGRSHESPRFMPDSTRLLVVRSEPQSDGARRNDLFLWDWKRGSLRRITHGAGIRSADPSPDGAWAIADRCLNGICDVVRVDLATGAVRTLVAGKPGTVYARPRMSPDGRLAVISIQETGVARLALVDVETGALTPVGPADGARRYDPSFLPGGGALVAVFEEGGIANLERIDLRTGEARALTRVTGAAMAPEPHPASGEVYFLSMHSGGYDLNRIHPERVAVGGVLALDPALSPILPARPVAAPDLVGPVPTPTAYGFGPRNTRLLPSGGYDADGGRLELFLINSDPVGRLLLGARAGAGAEGTPRGGSLTATWRGWRPSVRGELFAVRHHASRRGFAPVELDAEYFGGALSAEHRQTTSRGERRLHLGLSAGSLDATDGEAARTLGFVEATAGRRYTLGPLSAATALTLHGAAGNTAGTRWQRGIATLGVRAGVGGMALHTEVLYGTTSADAPAWERFSVGGERSELVGPGVLSQRVPMPLLPFGLLNGKELLIVRTEARVGDLNPFFWSARTEDDAAGWYRVAGLEARSDLGSAYLLGLPNIEVAAGAGIPLDEPLRHRLRSYVSFTLRP